MGGVTIFPPGPLYFENYDKINWEDWKKEDEMDKAVFICDCCGEEYCDDEMNDIDEYFICDSCIEELG